MGKNSRMLFGLAVWNVAVVNSTMNTLLLSRLYHQLNFQKRSYSRNPLYLNSPLIILRKLKTCQSYRVKTVTYPHLPMKLRLTKILRSIRVRHRFLLLNLSNNRRKRITLLFGFQLRERSSILEVHHNLKKMWRPDQSHLCQEECMEEHQMRSQRVQ